MKRDLDVGATLREVLQTYREQAGVLLPVAFWLFLLVAIVHELTGKDFSLFWIGLFFELGVATLYLGVVVALVRDLRDGRRDETILDLVRGALPVVGPLLAAGVLFGFGVVAGLVLLVVPGLYLATVWAVVVPVIVVERRPVFEAFGRSRQLVRDHGWSVFWILLIAYVIAIVASVAFAVIAASLANGPIVRVVFGVLAATLTAPITALVAATIYFRLLAIKAQPAPAEPVAP